MPDEKIPEGVLFEESTLKDEETPKDDDDLVKIEDNAAISA